MLNIGSRSNPSVLNLVLIVIVIFTVVDYLLISLDTGDWISNRYAENPKELIIRCYGKPINLDRGSIHFSALARLIDEMMSGQKRYDPNSMSLETYQGTQQSAGMVTIEFFYPVALRVQSGNRSYVSLDNLLVPLSGSLAHSGVMFGQHQGIPLAGSFQVDSTLRLNEYLQKQNICQTATSTQ